MTNTHGLVCVKNTQNYINTSTSHQNTTKSNPSVINSHRNNPNSTNTYGLDHDNTTHNIEASVSHQHTTKSKSPIIESHRNKLDSKTRTNVNDMRTMIINCQSILPKQAEFWHQIEELKPDIILATETWLSPSIHDSEVIHPDMGYTLFRKDRNDGWGGISIATKSNLNAHVLPLKENHDEVLLINISLVQSKSLTIGVMYRVPSNNTIEQITALTDSLDCINKDNTIWIGGDMNLPDIDWKWAKVIGHQYPRITNDIFFNKIQDLNLTQIVEKPTRGKNLLDLFLTNRPSLVNKVTNLPGLSDHDIVIADNRVKADKVLLAPRKINCWKRGDITALCRETQQLSDTILADESNDAEQIWSLISNDLLKLMDKHIPSKIKSSKFHQPWINTKLKRLSRKKKRAWKKAKETNSPTKMRRYETIKRETQKENRKAHQSFVRNLVSDESSPNKNLWKYINSRKIDSSGVAPLTHNNKIYSTNIDKANVLNDQFCKVFTHEDINDLPEVTCKDPTSMKNIKITVEGVNKLLLELKINKASGPDGISARLLRTVANEIAPALTKLFQISIDTGIIPKIWKHATVQPIFKKGSRSEASNYRPISLTCICCKLLEHIVRTEITKHIETNQMLSKNQHGFRKGRSCESQLISITQDLATTFNNGGQTDAILLDFAKAFDKVPHERLIRKVYAYGIQGKTLNWIRAFLKHRTQQVVVGGQKSKVGTVTSGVPQGSVLGPTLFLIYIDDISQNIDATVRLFADDTIIYREIRNKEDTMKLNEALQKLQNWEKNWQMQFNVSKCSKITFTNKKNPIQADYYLHNQALEQVDSAKYLGIELSSDLKWTTHITSMCKKANRSLGFIMRNLRGCPIDVKLQGYKTYIRPIMEYSSVVWDPNQQINIQNIEKIQKRAARQILNNFSGESQSDDLVEELKLESLETRRKFNKCITMYKLTNDIIITDIPNDIKYTQRHTRGHNKKIMIPHSRVNSHLHSFLPSSLRLWNKLPQNVINSGTLDHFRQQLFNVDWSSM